MTNRLRSWLAGARALEGRLATAVERAAASVAGAPAPTPLEILDRAIDRTAQHVLPAGRGRYGFPFARVEITFVAASPELQAHFEMLCVGPPMLQERVARRLRSAGCETPDVEVTYAFADAPEADWADRWFRIALARTAPEPAAIIAAASIALVVTHGVAERAEYTFTTTPIAIGRGTEVRDRRQQLLRVNHVAFVEGAGEATSSVSRRHARIERDEVSGRLRLIDDNSAQGTSLIRGGRGMAVPRGSRGLALQDGDEIVLGQARLTVRLAPTT